MDLSIIKYNKIERIQGWALAIIAIVSSMGMYHDDTTLVSEATHARLPLIIYFSIIILLVTTFIGSKTIKLYAPLCVCVLLWWVFTTFNVYHNTPINPRWLTLIILLIFCALKSSVWLYSFKLFRFYLIFTACYGILVYLSFVFFIPLPNEQVAYYTMSGEGSAFYLNYYLSYLVVSRDGARLCGLFNEPGYYGTILALYLVADGVNLKKRGNLIMLFGGFFTLSMAFFVIIGVFLFFKSLKTPKIIIVLLIAVLLFFLILHQLKESSDIINIFFERFAFTDGKIAGNNRTSDLFDTYWQRFIVSPSVLFGYGTGFIDYLQSLSREGSLSYKQVVIEQGIIGAGLMWGSLLKAAIKKGKHIQSGLFVLLFFISIYQRPTVIFITYFVLLFGGIEYIRKNEQASLSSEIIPQIGYH